MAASWCFRDEEHSDALAVWHRIRSDEAEVPLHWWFEIRNAILLGERRWRISQPEAAGFLADLRVLRIALTALPEEADVFALARRHRLTFYDAAYLELAKREQLPLATLDDALALAARAEGVALVVAPR